MLGCGLPDGLLEMFTGESSKSWLVYQLEKAYLPAYFCLCWSRWWGCKPAQRQTAPKNPLPPLLSPSLSGYTPLLLAILDAYEVKATFFLVGKKVEQHPDLVTAIASDGHNIGNHTYHHFNLTALSTDEAMLEIRAGAAALKRVTGQMPHLFRPPGGRVDDQVAECARGLGQITVFWTNNSGDYTNPGSEIIIDRVLSKVQNGGILLFHAGIIQTIDALPRIIATLKSRGYQFVTIDQMLADRYGSPAKVAAPTNGSIIAPTSGQKPATNKQKANL